MNKKVVSFCISSLVCSVMVAQNWNVQQKDSLKLQELEEVVVSDSRFSLKRENSGKTVIKITSKELEQNQGKSIAAIINTKSGIEIAGSRGREGAVLGVFARGGRGRQVLIIIDGVRVADPSSSSSAYDLRLLSTANVASIEILKGAASTLYGTNASTAVIQITTKKVSTESIALEVQSSMGTNQTAKDQNFNAADFSNSAQVSGTLERFSYAARISNTHISGLSALITPKNQEDKFSRLSTDIRIGYRFSDSFDLKMYGNQTKTSSDFDDSFGVADANFQFLTKQERLGISSIYNYNSTGAIILNAAYTAYKSESKSSFSNSFTGKNTNLDLYNKLSFGMQWHTILGLNYIKDETEFSLGKSYEIKDPYINLVYVSDFGLNLNVGGRLNNHSAYGDHFVYNLNPSFTFKYRTGYIKLMGSYATSFITPSLTQLFGNFGANAELQPEENRTLEGGIEIAVNNKVRVSSLYFNRKEKNFVFYDNVVSMYKNARNTIDAQGMEVALNWKLSNKWNVRSNYTFTERSGDNAIRIPKHKINAVVGFDFTKDFTMSLSYALTGERSDTDFSDFPFVDVPLNSFSLVDLYFGYHIIPDKIFAFINANNLMNTEYTEVLGFTTRGRNLRMGFQLKL